MNHHIFLNFATLINIIYIFYIEKRKPPFFPHSGRPSFHPSVLRFPPSVRPSFRPSFLPSILKGTMLSKKCLGGWRRRKISPGRGDPKKGDALGRGIYYNTHLRRQGSLGSKIMLSLSERTFHPEHNSFYGIQKSLPILKIFTSQVSKIGPFRGKNNYKIILKLRTKKAHFKSIFAPKRANFRNLRRKYLEKW